jgi:hypothetical protein
MMIPQARQMVDRKSLGPNLRVRSVAGGWKNVYVMKNTRAMIDWSTCQPEHREGNDAAEMLLMLTYRELPLNPRSTSMPAIIAFGRLLRSIREFM